jgi:hypothetical protein
MPEEVLTKSPRFTLLDHAAALAAGLVALVVYVYLLPTSITGEDAGELAAAAYVLGVPHPPGYPLWCLLAHGFTWIPLYTVAWRVALCSAVFGAATVYVLSLLCTRLSGSRLASVLASLALAFSFDFLGQATIPEVYTLNTFLTVWCWLLLALWHEQRKDQFLWALAVVHGLSLANHNTAIVLSPLFALFVVLVERQPLKRAPVYVALGMASLAVAFVLYCYLPLRSLANPPVDWGNPETLSNWWRHVTRGQYAFMLTEEPRSWGRLGRHVNAQIWEWWRLENAALLLCGAVSVWHLVWTRRLLPGLILSSGLMLSLVFLLIQNPDSTREWLTVMRVFHLPLFAALAVGVAVIFATGPNALRDVLRVPLVILVFGSAFDSVAFHLPVQRELGIEEYAQTVLDTLPPEAILVPNADHHSFPLQYLQVVKAFGSDVTLARKYGYIDMGLFPPEFVEKWGEFPPRRAEPELFAWLVENSKRPLYFFKRPLLDRTGVQWQSCWVLERAVRPWEAVDGHDCIWSKDTRNLPENVDCLCFGWPTLKLSDNFLRNDYTVSVIKVESFMKEAECHYEWSADVADQYVIFALDAYGRDSKSLYNAGVFYARRDEYEQARTYFEEALAIDPEHRPSLEAIARLEGMGH